MRLTRVHCDAPLESGREFVLPESAAQHVAKVLRLRAGESLVLFDGRGREHEAEIVSIVQGRVTARVLEQRTVVAESRLAITLVQAVSRGERMDLTLQKATELGVHAIVPVITSRSIVRLDDEQANRKLRHWRSIVVSACEQSGRSVVPEVRPCVSFASFLAAPGNATTRIVLDPASTHSLAAIADPGASIQVLIGPEGGLDDSELANARETCFQPVGLGPRTLRTETAGLAALAILQARWGDLR